MKAEHGNRSLNFQKTACEIKMLKQNLKNILRLAYICLFLFILGFITLLPSTSSPTLAQSPWTTYEDNDPLVLAGYSEGDWQTVSIAEAVGGNLTWTDVPGAELVLYFEGSAIEILHSRGPEGGDFHISLDDMTWPPFNGYAEQYLYGTSIQQFNISPGVHQLVMTNGDGALWIEAIRVQDGALLPAIQWTAYPSNDPDVLYTGMWASMPSADVTQESVMYSFTGERSLSVRFQGTGIRVIYSREYQSGLNLQARVDHAATQSVSHPAPSENTQHEIVFDTLPYDEHTLHITIAAGTLWVERIDIQGTLLPAEAPLESSASRSAPLALESTLPLVFTEVSTVEELVSAVEAANAAINEHHVILLTPGTYTFDGSSSMWVEAALIVAAYKTVTFIGMGGIDPETGDSLLPADHPASQSWPWATLAMNPADSLNLLDTQVGSTVRLYNIQLRGGGGDPTLRYAGGGIRNSGDLFLYNSRLEDNQANVSAGAILNFANLTTINTALSDNYAVYGSAVFKWNSASIVSYCSTYEGNAAYIGALNLETGGSVDLRHSNFIGNETFDEEFDTFADVYSADPVTLPNNYWSGSVGESVNEHVNRSPQSPSRILYGSFSNEGEPCYVPPPPMETKEIAVSEISTSIVEYVNTDPYAAVEVQGRTQPIPHRDIVRFTFDITNNSSSTVTLDRMYLTSQFLNAEIVAVGGTVKQANYKEARAVPSCQVDFPGSPQSSCSEIDNLTPPLLKWNFQNQNLIELRDLGPGDSSIFFVDMIPQHSGEFNVEVAVFVEDAVEPFTSPSIKQLEVPVTLIPLHDPQEREYVKSFIFWMIYNETSEDGYEHHGFLEQAGIVPDAVSTAFLRGTGCLQEDPWGDELILNNCDPAGISEESLYFVYLHTQTMLNGLINYERSTEKYDPYLYFLYGRSNYRGSIGTTDYALWAEVNNSCEVVSIPGIGDIQYADAIGSNRAAILWLHHYRECLVDANPQTFKAVGYDQIITTAWGRFEPIINLAINDFINTPQDDPLDGSVFIKAANQAGNAYALCVGGCSDPGGAYDIPISDVTQSLVEITYNDFITDGIQAYNPGLATILRPVLWTVKNYRRSLGGYEYAGYTWLSISYQVPDSPDDRNVPR